MEIYKCPNLFCRFQPFFPGEETSSLDEDEGSWSERFSSLVSLSVWRLVKYEVHDFNVVYYTQINAFPGTLQFWQCDIHKLAGSHIWARRTRMNVWWPLLVPNGCPGLGMLMPENPEFFNVSGSLDLFGVWTFRPQKTFIPPCMKVDGANPPCNGLSWPLTNRHLFWEWLQVAIYLYYGEKNIQKQTLINWNILCLRFFVQLMARGETLKCQKNGWTANKPWHHDMYLKTTIGKSPYRRYIDSFILVFPLSY